MHHKFFASLLIRADRIKDAGARKEFLRKEFLRYAIYLRHKRLLIDEGNRVFILVEPSDLFYAEAEGNYTYLHYRDNGINKKHVFTCNLGAVEELLYELGMIRVGKSFMINPNTIAKIFSEERKVLLKNGSMVEVSKRSIPMLIHYLEPL